ncbi:hypothetical protein UB32_03640 [Mesobacillus subterraneus]|uniref:Uncharacterized protein n=1 Tax=Mesobacillus subterraneus TaxID=285983 RepID=A0A0D6ZDZ2_9BACI|nr:hypothetical protein UB32_03640 [Mesobacillus subterraneus]
MEHMGLVTKFTAWTMTQEWKSKENASRIISKVNGWSPIWTEESTPKQRNSKWKPVYSALVSLFLL